MLSEPQIQTNSKGKPTGVTHEDVEYVCIPLSQFDRVAADFINTVDKCSESPVRTSFASGYRFALERLGLHYFNQQLPEVPNFQHQNMVRKQINIGGASYYEDEVLERLKSLSTVKSIQRKWSK